MRITAERFREPVMCEDDGSAYWRVSVQRRFAEEHTTRPKRGAELGSRQLIPNVITRRREDTPMGSALKGMTRSSQTLLLEPA